MKTSLRPSLLLFLGFSTGFQGTAMARGFDDIPQSHWASSDADWLRDEGLLQGWSGKLHGSSYFTRYELVTLLSRFMKRYRQDRDQIDQRFGKLEDKVETNSRDIRRLDDVLTRREGEVAAAFADPEPRSPAAQAVARLFASKGSTRSSSTPTRSEYPGTAARSFDEGFVTRKALTPVATPPSVPPEPLADLDCDETNAAGSTVRQAGVQARRSKAYLEFRRRALARFRGGITAKPAPLSEKTNAVVLVPEGAAVTLIRPGSSQAETLRSGSYPIPWGSQVQVSARSAASVVLPHDKGAVLLHPSASAVFFEDSVRVRSGVGEPLRSSTGAKPRML